MKKSLVLSQNFKPVGYRKGLITIKKAFPRAFPLDRLTFVLRQISHWEPVLDWILLNQGHYFGLSSLLMVLTLFPPTFWWNVTQLYFQGYLVTLRCDRFDVTRLIICTDIYESESEVAQSCLTLCEPVDCSLPGSSIHGILQARILEWVAISFSRGSSPPRDWTQISHIAGRCFNLWVTREAPRYINNLYWYIYICIYMYIHIYVCVYICIYISEEFNFLKKKKLGYYERIREYQWLP